VRDFPLTRDGQGLALPEGMRKHHLAGGLAAILALPIVQAGCGKDSGNGSAVPSDVKAIIFVQRPARNEGVGDVFQYTSYKPGAKLVKLEPPSADGKLTNLTADGMFAQADIQSWDLSFDATQVVFSAKLAAGDHYHLFAMGVDGSNVRQLTEGDDNYVYPIFLPGGRVMFTSSKSVEQGSPQFRDEYERGTTAQVGTINIDGTGETLGARNVSHRVAPALLPDGRVVYSEWRHLGSINDGHLRIMNSDMTAMREAFGGELGPGNAGTNSYLKARYVETTKTEDGKDSFRLVAIGTSRDRTLQSGKLLLLDLGDSEAHSTSRDLTPLVPGDREPSKLGVGRYYDAEPIGGGATAGDLKLLVSWADGPVHSQLLAEAKTEANFGLYVFDTKTGTRFPVYDDPMMWDVLARPVKARNEPPTTESPINGTSFTLGALNVYDTSIEKIPAGSAVKVRLLEGFSTEEGFPSMFGLTDFDGQSLYGEVPVYADGSFAAKVPGNVPLHMQVLDKFAMSEANENVWISGRAGEQRFCGGCHEDRAKTNLIAPGTTEAVQRGPIDLDVPRAERLSLDFAPGKVRGVPWDKALQPIFDAKCVSCHDGDASKPGNPTYTVVDKTAMTEQTFVFDLRGDKLPITVGQRMTGDFTASHISLIGLGMELGENIVEITGDYRSYITPGLARTSDVIKRLNPPQRWPDIDTKTRAFPNMKIHPVDVGGEELTPDEYYLLILNIDMGGQFYFRENKGGR